MNTKVNCTFTYNGKICLGGASSAILDYSTTNDSSKAVYETVAGVASSTATVEAGVNTRTVEYNNFTPQHGTKYYFWIKVMNPAHSISDSAWSNVAEFIYP